MKAIILSVMIALCATFAFAQNAAANWPALKEMHEVVSQTYHPSEEGNLLPAKARTAELVSKATALDKSKVPAGLDKARMKEATSSLLAAAKKVEKMVKDGAGDKELKDQMVVVHDAYHQIAGLCTKGD